MSNALSNLIAILAATAGLLLIVTALAGRRRLDGDEHAPVRRGRDHGWIP